jgi:biotin carboxyl carrier protein
MQAISGNFDEKTVRLKLLQIAMRCTGAAGACFLNKNLQDQWVPSINAPTVGRIPDRQKFAEKFSEKCDRLSGSNNAIIEKLPSLNNSQGLLASLRPRNSQPEIILLVLRSQKDSFAAMATIKDLANAMQLWLNGRNSADAEWQVHALSSIIELVAKIENQTSTKTAAEETVNMLANRIGCSSVAIGMFRKGKMRLEAISGVSKLDHGSEASRNYLQTLVESASRKQPGVFPATNEGNDFLLQAHRQLAAQSQCESVYTQPLICEDDSMIGAVVLTGTKAMLQSTQVERFGNAAAPAIANALRVSEKVKLTIFKRTKSYVGRKLSLAKQFILISAVIGFCLLMFLPITYRVRCNCVTEPVTRRFAVAPFDGQIETGHAEAGDFVEAGQTLAEMDGRTIRWELSTVTAEREQSLITRESELSERNIPKAMLAELEYDRLVSEEAILEFKRQHLQIKSPIAGVVLSGSLERAEAASIETGQVLFEIGPLQPMRVEIAIPGNEISQVKTGCPVKVWINGQEEEPIEAKIKKIHPRSETRDAKNVFIAEIEFPNDDQRLRPGMKGSVRIDCEERSLGWSLFHKPMNYVRSRLTWW